MPLRSRPGPPGPDAVAARGAHQRGVHVVRALDATRGPRYRRSPGSRACPAARRRAAPGARPRIRPRRRRPPAARPASRPPFSIRDGLEGPRRTWPDRTRESPAGTSPGRAPGPRRAVQGPRGPGGGWALRSAEPPARRGAGWSSSIIATTFVPGMSRWSTTTSPRGLKSRRTSVTSPQGMAARIVAPCSIPGTTRSST